MPRPIRGILKTNQVNVSTDSYSGIYSLRDAVNNSIDGTVPVSTSPQVRFLKNMGGVGQSWWPAYAGNIGTVNGPVVFSKDGTHMYLAFDSNVVRIVHYTLATAFDPSTAVFSELLMMPGGEASGFCFAIDDDGQYLITHDTALDDITTWKMSNAYQLSSATEFSRNENWTTTQQTTFVMSSDGTKLWTSAANSTIYEHTMSTPYDVTTLNAYTSPTATFNNPKGVHDHVNGFTFGDDGNKLFLLDDAGADRAVLAYNLSTPYDITSATFVDGTSFLFSEYHDGALQGIQISSDGKNFFFEGESRVIHMELETAWDVSTAIDGWKKVLSVTGATNPGGLYIKPDGQSYWSTHTTADYAPTVLERRFMTKFQPSTAVQTGIMAAVEWTGMDAEDIYFKPDGTKFYVLNSTEEKVTEFNLSTAWDIRTISLSHILDIGDQETGSKGMYIRKDGLKLYVIGTTGDDISEYTLSSAWDLSTATFTQISAIDIGTDANGVEFDSDGNYVYITTTGDIIDRFPLTTPWDVSTIQAIDESLNVVTGGDTTPQKMRWKPGSGGTQFYLTGSSTDDLHLWSTVSPWTLTGATGDSSSGPHSMERVHIDSAQPYLYTADITQDLIYRYGTTTPGVFNKDTVDPDLMRVYDHSSEVTAMGDIALSSDGTKMYLSQENVNMYQYTLSTPWDISTATYDSVTLNLDATDGSTQAFCFANNGTELYTVGRGNYIVKYDLSTAWDISTAVEASSSKALALQDLNWKAIDINPSRTKIYVSDETYGLTYQFNLNTPGDLSDTNFIGQIFTARLTEERVPLVHGIRVIGNKLYRMDGNSEGVPVRLSSTISTIDLEDSENIGTAITTDRKFTGNLTQTATSNYATPYITNTGNLLLSRIDGAPYVGSVISEYSNAIVGSIDTTDSSRFSYGSYYQGQGEYVTHTELNRFSRTYMQFRNHSENIIGIKIKPDGTKLFTLGGMGAYSEGDINEYTLTTPHDLSTATYVRTAFLMPNYKTNVSVSDDYPDFEGLDISDDGQHLITAHWYNDELRHWIMDTPWDISTIRYKDQLSGFGSYYTDLHSVLYNRDGSKLFVAGIGATNIGDATGLTHNATFSNRITTYALDSAYHPSSATATSPDSDIYFASGSTEMFRLGGSTLGDHFVVTNTDASLVQRLDAIDASNSTSNDFNSQRMFNRNKWNILTELNALSNSKWSASANPTGWYSAGFQIAADGSYARSYQASDPNDTTGYVHSWNMSGLNSPFNDYTRTQAGTLLNIASGPFFLRSATQHYWTFRNSTSQDDKWYYPSTSLGSRIYQGGASWNTSATYTDFTYDEVVGFTFNKNGSRVYISYKIGWSAEYTVPTPWDLTSISNVDPRTGANHVVITAELDNLQGDIAWSNDGKLLFVLNHKVNELSWIEVWSATRAFSLAGLQRTGIVIHPPSPYEMVYDDAMILANSLCIYNDVLFVVPFNRYNSGTANWQDMDIFYIDLGVEADILR